MGVFSPAQVRNCILRQECEPHRNCNESGVSSFYVPRIHISTQLRKVLVLTAFATRMIFFFLSTIILVVLIKNKELIIR